MARAQAIFAEVATEKHVVGVASPFDAGGDDTLQIEVGGEVALLSQTASVGTKGIGLIAAAIILLLVFGSVAGRNIERLQAGTSTTRQTGDNVLAVADGLAKSARVASAWRRPCSSTPRSSGWSWCRPR